MDTSGPYLRALAVALAAAAIGSFCLKFIKTRMFYRSLPGPPHSLLFGHLPAMLKAKRTLPNDCHPQLILNALVREYDLYKDGVMYTDTYPIRDDRQLIVFSPSVAAQVGQTHVMRKHPLLKDAFGAVVGRKSISILEGAEWKKFRSLFNPGFSSTNILTLMPAMLEECEVFVSKLSKIANSGGYTPSMMSLLKGVTVDIIFRSALGTRIRSQEIPNETVELLAAAALLPDAASLNPLSQYNFVRMIKINYYEWRIKQVITKDVLERWEYVKENPKDVAGKQSAQGKAKTIIDLALQEYWQTMTKASKPVGSLDPEFLTILCDNIKGFVFGGHDTTANSLSWLIYEIYRHPDILEEIRQEHAAVFGPNADAVSDVIREKPHLLNNLPFTLAAIKEGMRLYAPASSIRESDPGMELTLNGQTLPTRNQLIFIPSHIMNRDPNLYPAPDSFIPQRFLPSHPLSQKIDPDAYRPFERGPRNCIGQDLAMTESKIVIALVIRRFNFIEAYEELNKRRGTPWPAPQIPHEGGYAYPVLFTTAQPKDGLPMWISNASKN